MVEWNASTIGAWYEQAIKDAEGSTGEVEAEPLAHKLIEEAVELAIALGATPTRIDEYFCNALNKETEKMGAVGYVTPLPGEEFADCVIVMCALQHVHGISHFDLAKTVDAKMNVNVARKWRMNGFKGLSHIKPTVRSE